MKKKLTDLTDWQITQIMRGERPDGIEFDDFKLYKKQAKNLMENYLGGRYIHISSQLVEVPKDDKEEKSKLKRVTNTYVKPKNN